MEVYPLFKVYGYTTTQHPMHRALMGIFSTPTQAEKALRRIAKEKKSQSRWKKVVAKKDVILCVDKECEDYVEEFFFNTQKVDTLSIWV